MVYVRVESNKIWNKMNKLKTLKDLRIWEPDIYGNPEEKNLGRYDAEELRQEAIKWLKEIQISDSVNSPVLAEDWIKTFFNITEELK